MDFVMSDKIIIYKMSGTSICVSKGMLFLDTAIAYQILNKLYPDASGFEVRFMDDEAKEYWLNLMNDSIANKFVKEYYEREQTRGY